MNPEKITNTNQNTPEHDEPADEIIEPTDNSIYAQDVRDYQMATRAAEHIVGVRTHDNLIGRMKVAEGGEYQPGRKYWLMDHAGAQYAVEATGRIELSSTYKTFGEANEGVDHQMIEVRVVDADRDDSHTVGDVTWVRSDVLQNAMHVDPAEVAEGYVAVRRQQQERKVGSVVMLFDDSERRIGSAARKEGDQAAA